MSSKELYRATEGTTVWTFTSSNEAEIYNLETYEPRVVGRSDVSDKPQVSKGTLDVSFPLEDDFAQHLLNASVDDILKLTIFSKDQAGTIRTEWRGRLKNTAPSNKELKATFEGTFSSNRRVGARPVLTRTCRHCLYSPGCGLDIADWLTPATVTALSVDGKLLTVPEAGSQPSGYFNAGLVKFSDGTMRYITSHIGTSVTIIRYSGTLNDEFAVSSPVDVELAPGCNQLMSDCGPKFDNLNNNGSFPFLPIKNPLGGSSIV